MNKILSIIILLVIFTNAKEIKKVYIAIKPVTFNQYIHRDDLVVTYKEVNPRVCKDLDVIALTTNRYKTRIYIPKGKIVCLKDLKLIEVKKVNFRFGNLEIQREVEDIKETKHYIKIRELDGKEEKIYKNGNNI
jgi:hypothetical protein